MPRRLICMNPNCCSSPVHPSLIVPYEIPADGHPENVGVHPTSGSLKRCDDTDRRAAADALFVAVWPDLVKLVCRRARRWNTLRFWADEVSADVALHVLEQLRALRALPDNVHAWLNTVTEHRLTDLHRKFVRRARLEGTEVPDPRHPGCLLRELDGRRALREFESAIHEYTARAEARGRRGHHVRSWLETELLERPANALASRLAAERNQPVSVTVVWKWSERGRRLILELADDDVSRKRGTWVRTVVEGMREGGPTSRHATQGTCVE